MPTIYKPKKKFPQQYKRHGQQAEIQKIYNSSIWQKLRKGYLMEHPLCEVCLSNGKVAEAKEIHHIREISNAKSFEEMQDIAYNPYNLQALCLKCHHEIHTERHRNNATNR